MTYGLVALVLDVVATRHNVVIITLVDSFRQDGWSSGNNLDSASTKQV